MPTKFWGEGPHVMRLVRDDTNDLVDIYGDDHDSLWASDIYAALRPLGYKFSASWRAVPSQEPSGAGTEDANA